MNESTVINKFSKYGMNYGWLGKQAVLYVDDIVDVEHYDEFIDFAKENQSDIKKLIDVKSVIMDTTDLAIDSKEKGIKQLINPLNLYIHCSDIGEGLFIEHGFSTIIACKHIGRNCWINQQVTIGFSDKTHSPYIGDNVGIKAGAKVIGGVTIGDDVIIGANAVVVKDVPSHSIVAGVPARVIKTRNCISEEWVKVK